MMFLKAPKSSARTQFNLDRPSAYRGKVDIDEEFKARRFIATKRKRKFTKIKKRILIGETCHNIVINQLMEQHQIL